MTVLSFTARQLIYELTVWPMKMMDVSSQPDRIPRKGYGKLVVSSSTVCYRRKETDASCVPMAVPKRFLPARNPFIVEFQLARRGNIQKSIHQTSPLPAVIDGVTAAPPKNYLLILSGWKDIEVTFGRRAHQEEEPFCSFQEPFLYRSSQNLSPVYCLSISSSGTSLTRNGNNLIAAGDNQ